MKLELEAHFIDPLELVWIIGFLTTIKLPCETNIIYKWVAMRVLPNYAKEVHENALNSRIWGKDQLSPIAASICNKKRKPSNLLRSYEEVLNYLLTNTRATERQLGTTRQFLVSF